MEHQHQHHCNTKSYPSLRASRNSSLEGNFSLQLPQHKGLISQIAETEPNTKCKICLEKKWRREIFVLDCGDKYCFEVGSNQSCTYFPTNINTHSALQPI